MFFCAIRCFLKGKGRKTERGRKEERRRKEERLRLIINVEYHIF